MSPHQNAAENAVEADVIILSWNRVEDTIAAIASAAEQEGVEKRIFIVDQGSTPETIAELESFLKRVPNAELKKLPRNSGVPGGRNIATGLGNGRYVVALDNDAVFAGRDMLARAVRHLDSNPDLCAVGFRILNYFTGADDELSWDYPAANRRDRSFPTTRFIGAGHAIRRSVFERVGGYDERLFFCGEELDLCYRMLNIGYRVQYFPEVTIRHKVSPQQRVFWGEGRYFYTVRNALYTSYKFGTPLPRLVLSTAAFLIKGAQNGVLLAALRGVCGAVPMCIAYSRSSEDKSCYRLVPETWRYILDCEPWRSEGVARKILRQFGKLPHHGKRMRRSP